MDPFIMEDSDTDSIDTDTTAESVHSEDTGFNVEQILQEDTNAQGVKLYLVKWEGYPLHRASWEDRKQFESGLPLQQWEQRKRAAKQGGQPLFDVDLWHEAYERANDEKEDKARRRAAKRRRRSEKIASGSQSPIKRTKSAPETSRKASAALAVKKKGVAQKVMQTTKPAEPGTISANAASKLEASPPSKTTEPAPKSSQPARKTAPNGPLIGASVLELKRRQRPRVSGDTPKDSTAPKFKNLSTQNRFQSYSRNEPAPDINALVMLDLKTGKPLSDQAEHQSAAEVPATPSEPIVPKSAETEPSQPLFVEEAPVQAAPSEPNDPRPSTSAQGAAQDRSKDAAQPEPAASTTQQKERPKLTTTLSNNASSRSTDIHCAYGRRTPPQERRRRSPSPITPQPAASDKFPTSDLPANHPKRTICRFWQAGNCQYTAETCRFAHSYVNTVSKTKGITCYYWFNGYKCNKSAETCDFAHEDTGVYAGRPGTFLTKHRMSYGAQVQLSANEIPVNHERRQQADAAPMYGEPQQAPMIVPTPTDAMHTAMDDSILPADTMPFVNANADETAFMDEEKAQATTQTIKQDLELAKKSIGELDASVIFNRGKSEIKRVYVLMPPERDGERELLVQSFKSFNREVYHSGMLQHWDFFRKSSADKESLIVIHPTEQFLGTIPNFANYIQRGKCAVFSIGVHEDWERSNQPVRRYKARRVFPHGGITFISDDVFEYYPEKAVEIIQEFHAKAKTKPPGAETSKIGARPGIRDWLASLAVKKLEEGGENYTDDRYVKCYEAICDLCPLEHYDPWEMEQGCMVPKDDALLWSVAEQDLPSFQGLWEKDEAKATDMMANLFAGTALERMSDFLRYSFIYQRPDQVGLSGEVTASQLPPQVVLDQVDPRGWMKRYNHIEVLTPDRWLEKWLEMEGRKTRR